MNEKNVPYATLINFVGIVFTIGVTLFLMIYGRSIVMPIIIALLITFLISAISEPLEQIQLFGRSMPTWLARAISIFVIGFGFWLMGRMGRATIREMIRDRALLTENINRLLSNAPRWLIDFLPPVSSVRHSIPSAADLFSGGLDFMNGFVSQFVGPVASFAGQFLIVLVYVIFMLIEQRDFATKLGSLYSDDESNVTLQRVLKSIGDNVRAYFRIKTLVSLMVGGASLIVMLIFGLENAFFWAILIFLLNYIPYLGSVVAVVFPALFSLAQFGDWTIFFILTSILYAIQIFSGSFVEPLLAGRSLNLSPLVVFASLATFGSIWGVPGMILSVPIVLIMTIAFGHFEATRPIAVLFSGRGQLTNLEPEVVIKRRRPPAALRLEDDN
ncbi:MAG: AI-2 transport protein TqsA [Cellvibrionaceae bacterium]|jgi:AI-2 transport protein TqsA